MFVYRRNFVCDDGDLSPPLLKVVVTVATIFSSLLVILQAQLARTRAEIIGKPMENI